MVNIINSVKKIIPYVNDWIVANIILWFGSLMFLLTGLYFLSLYCHIVGSLCLLKGWGKLR